jgi:predicted RNA binding protein YcfA (HicA-like mRNA interferase family)
MKLARDITGQQLVKALKILGYAPTRQSGSHIREQLLKRRAPRYYSKPQSIKARHIRFDLG